MNRTGAFFFPFLHVKEQRGQKSEQRLMKEGFWGLVVGWGSGGGGNFAAWVLACLVVTCVQH